MPNRLSGRFPAHQIEDNACTYKPHTHTHTRLALARILIHSGYPIYIRLSTTWNIKFLLLKCKYMWKKQHMKPLVLYKVVEHGARRCLLLAPSIFDTSHQLRKRRVGPIETARPSSYCHISLFSFLQNLSWQLFIVPCVAHLLNSLLPGSHQGLHVVKSKGHFSVFLLLNSWQCLTQLNSLIWNTFLSWLL